MSPIMAAAVLNTRPLGIGCLWALTLHKSIILCNCWCACWCAWCWSVAATMTTKCREFQHQNKIITYHGQYDSDRCRWRRTPRSINSINTLRHCNLQLLLLIVLKNYSETRYSPNRQTSQSPNTLVSWQILDVWFLMTRKGDSKFQRNKLVGQVPKLQL